MKFYSLFFLSFSLTLLSCSPIEFTSPNGEGDSLINPSRGSDSLPEDGISPFVGEEEFKDFFVSDKADLVFILDSQPGMNDFYKKTIFPEENLASLKGYDWKARYTNTSVDRKLFEEAFPNQESRKCGFRKLANGSWLTYFGLKIHPVTLPFAATSFASCLSSISFKKRYKKVNGEFLPFELNGKKMGKELSKADNDYATIFHHTVTKNTDSNGSYDAPQNQNENSSAPLYALFLSLIRGEFREDSQIIYVIVAPVDTNQDISAEDLREDFSKLHGRKDRLHVIPLVINEEDSLCTLKMKDLGVKNPQPGKKLSQIALDMEIQPISLCSNNPGDELQAQIANLLYPSDVL